MISITVLVLLRTSIEAVQFQAQSIPSFASFVQTYQRTYKANSTEYKQREALYVARAAAASNHNQQAQKLWDAGVNKFWDWTDAERESLRGRRGESSMTRGGGGGKLAAVHRSDFLSKNHTVLGNSTATLGIQSLPLSGDWTHLEIGQRIPDQGACGSCWAIAASTTLEGNYEIHSNGQSRTFAVQEMVDCIPNPRECGGQGGCRGATLELAMDWVLKNGCYQEHELPYQAKDTSCTKTVFSTSSASGGQAFGLVGWEKLQENSYDKLMLALQDGPVGVSVAAADWFAYSRGIFDGCPKDTVIDHAVTMMAYGADNTIGVKYWKIQNSWGKYWGEDGYMRLLRRADDSTYYCGINNKPELGTGCRGGPSQVTVCGMCGILYDSVIPHFR
jgi:cathepsin L